LPCVVISLRDLTDSTLSYNSAKLANPLYRLTGRTESNSSVCRPGCLSNRRWELEERACLSSEALSPAERELESLTHEKKATHIWRVGDELMTSVHVAHMQGGQLAMPPTTRSLFIEIGCSDFDTLDTSPEFVQSPHAFIVSFEPLIDKWATLLHRGSKDYHRGVADRATPLGRHHRRGLVLPFAVADIEGMQTISVSHVAGCSSLLPFNPNVTWGRFCLNVTEHRRVPAITLELALRLTGTLSIELLKIDAQGLDLRLLNSLSNSVGGRGQLKRVRNVSLEVVRDGCPTLYQGQPGFQQVLVALSRLGFHSFGVGWKGGGCEGDARFTRAGALPLATVSDISHDVQRPPGVHWEYACSFGLNFHSGCALRRSHCPVPRHVASLSECQRLCSATVECASIVHNRLGQCFLKYAQVRGRLEPEKLQRQVATVSCRRASPTV